MEEHYGDYLKTVRELSSNGKKSLVEDDCRQYAFDDLSEQVFPTGKKPTSEDGLAVLKMEILLTEFKTGFRDKISVINQDLLKCCDDEAKTCREYGKLLIRKRTLEKKELLDSIKMKAVESYLTLEKKFFPKCDEIIQGENLKTVRGYKIKYCVVIDDYVDSMEDTLAEMAHHPVETNSITMVRNALNRFVGLRADDEDYLYDEIKVVTPWNFLSARRCYG